MYLLHVLKLCMFLINSINHLQYSKLLFLLKFRTVWHTGFMENYSSEYFANLRIPVNFT